MSITPGTWKVMRYFDCNSHPRYNVIVEGTETVIAKEIADLDNAWAISKVPEIIAMLTKVDEDSKKVHAFLQSIKGSEKEL